MNRLSVLAASAVAATAVTSSHAAFVLDLGNNTLAGGQSVTYTFDLEGTLTNFAVSFFFVDQPSSASWASDMILQIIDPNGGNQYWGGFNVTPSGSTFQSFWSFDGSGSTNSGPYSDNNNPVAGLSGSGTWTFRIWNGWNASGAKGYNDFQVKVVGLSAIPTPAPGVLALLGIAGLAGGRRRRA